MWGQNGHDVSVRCSTFHNTSFRWASFPEKNFITSFKLFFFLVEADIGIVFSHCVVTHFVYLVFI